MTPQEVFNKGLWGIRNQGRPAAGPYGCQYRMPNGDKCAVGQCITDEEYKKSMEGHNIATIINHMPSLLPRHLLEHKDLLVSMQYAHDSAIYSDFMVEFEGVMRNVASRFGLEYATQEEESNQGT